MPNGISSDLWRKVAVGTVLFWGIYLWIGEMNSLVDRKSEAEKELCYLWIQSD
jgi:hypothetical protein